MEDRRKSQRLPDQTEHGLKLGEYSPGNKWNNKLQKWAQESAKLQAARRNRGIYEVWTDDKNYFTVIADARLKLEKDTASAFPCTEKEDSRGKPRAVATSMGASEKQSDSKSTGACGKVEGQHVDHIAEKRVCGKLSQWLGTQASFFTTSFEDTRIQSRRG